MAKALFHTVEWSDFKSYLRDAIFDGKAPEGMKINSNSFIEHARSSGSWRGYSSGQLQRWITEGYKTEAIHGLGEFIPPVRDKRKLIFGEEGDEFHFDIAASGDDNYMSFFTKQESIPGVAIEAGIMFSAGVSAETVNAYNTWLCKCAYSLEASGIDTQITLDFPSWNLSEGGGRRVSAGTGTLFHNIVKVKKENEASDFLSWSPMLSPAALRNFGFALGDLHCEALGERITGSFGRGVPERHSWRVNYNAERRTIEVVNAYSAYGSFPEVDMTRQFREALKTMQGKLTN